MNEDQDLTGIAAEVVSAYVANNTIPPGELPALIRDVHSALSGVGSEVAQPEIKEPAVSVRRSVKQDAIICLEDGKKFKSLKRHLSAEHGLTPEEYREKWSLPGDYPMVAPSYAEQRSQLAKKSGLGQKRKKR